MFQLRVDVFVHDQRQDRIEQKLDQVLEVLVTDPAKLAALIDRLKASNATLKAAEDAANPPNPVSSSSTP